ncbi:MAG TPA: GNAT family protein [Aggregatilineales bacterium]|nr:GNAT family N-acetyltransferase [Anaerolineales bacterium]HRE47045.1 GNAT family protein [Aggregatilineales bacterium]
MPYALGDLYTGKLARLTAPLSDDKDALARWSNDAEFQRLLFMRSVRPQAPDFFTLPKPEDESKYITFHIRTNSENKFIGFVTLWGIVWSNQAALLAVGIGEPEYRGRGYGTEATDLVLGYGFREMNLHRIGLVVFAFNAPAIRSYEKLGFVREGAQREAVYRDGAYHDLIQMAILRSEWEARKAKE